ncbi:MAG: hypothetical protein ACXWPM_04120 [Bdellovibrionota bacterium]
MKVHGLWNGFVLIALAITSLQCQANAAESDSRTRVEVPIGQVFIPPQGYDDNDNIQFVLDGILPNGCFSAANPDVQVDPSDKHISAHLYAYVRSDGACADQNHLPNSLVAPVPYTLEVSLGVLASGNYRIVYPRPGLSLGMKEFQVVRAHVSSVDDRPYASVTSIWIPDTVRGDVQIHAELVGSLTSTCSSLTSSEITVKRVDDVFVVLPVLSFKLNVLCTMMMVPFERTIDLGKPGEGRYLIHSRSLNGHSVNRTFSAIVPDPGLRP